MQQWNWGYHRSGYMPKYYKCFELYGAIGRRDRLPWVKQEDCVGCSICVEACTVNAISMIDEKAEINMDKCIRCGICHDVCPQDAVRHDSEKIPQEVEENIEWTKDLLRHYETEKEREAFIQRIKKHFVKERKIIEKTLERLNSLKI